MDNFIGEIRIFGGNFAPRGWALCNGQLLPISQNTALFALLGTMYGGDGKSTFALPNLQESAPLHTSSSPDYDQGAAGGVPFVTLLESEMPAHSHAVNVSLDDGDLKSPSAQAILGSSIGGSAYQSNTSSSLVQMNQAAVTIGGGSLPHNNLQPYLALTFIIALQGIFPPRG